MSVKISSLEVENVKRVKAVQLSPAPDGLTVIGGGNGQGKTSVLDAIAWALGGDRRKPSGVKREGASRDPRLRVELSNGIVVERRGKNGALHVTDPKGEKGGQALLDSFVGQLALDMPRFMQMNGREKADELLKAIGVGDELAALDAEQQRLEVLRLEAGRVARQKRGAAEELPMYADAPEREVSARELIARQEAILARNGENRRLRSQANALREAAKNAEQAVGNARERLADMRRSLAEAERALAAKEAEAEDAKAKAETAAKSAEQLADESTAEVEVALDDIDRANEKVRANARRARAMADDDEFEARWRELDAEVDAVRDRKRALLEGVNLPLPGLTVEDGEVVYNGRRWDCMSGSEQMRVATAVVRAVRPECGFVLVDKLEQMDAATLADFAQWCEAEGLQVIGTRVAVDGTCTVVIEDGLVVTPENDPDPAGANAVPAAAPKFNFPKGAAA